MYCRQDHLRQTSTDKHKTTVSLRTRFLTGTLILITLIASHCKTTGQPQQESLQQLVQKKLGDSTTVEYNETKNYAIFTQVEAYKKMATRPIHYIVARLKDKTIVQSGSFMRGYIKWISPNTIEVLSLPGKVQWNKDMEAFKKQIIINTP